MKQIQTAFLFFIAQITSAFLSDKDMATPLLVDAPVVSCQIQRLSFEIETRQPFNGRLFVKGHSNDKDCAIDFFNNGDPKTESNYTRKAKIEIDFHKCGMERIRSLSPKGVTYANTITVQFHRTFITQGDKSFRVRCFYAEQQKAVTSDFDVSMVPTRSIERDMELPSCGYSIRAGTPNGPVVRTGNVGDLVYHRWECTTNMQVYGMLVHSCVIENDGGRETLMIDPLGCAVEPDIVPGLSYNDDLSLAHTSTRVFKYPDDSILRFRCQIRICTKMDKGCDGLTPPSCETSRKIRRSIPDTETGNDSSSSAFLQERPLIGDEEGSAVDGDNRVTAFANLDVVTPDIFVLDEDEQQTFGVGVQQQRVETEFPEEQSPKSQQVATRTDRLEPDEAYDLSGTMPQYKAQRQTSYTSFYDGLISITPSPAPTSSSDHRRSTIRRGTDTTTTTVADADTVTFTSDVHSSRWELCVNRVILISILFGFVLFFAGSILFVVYVLMDRAKAEIGQPIVRESGTVSSLPTIITVADAFSSNVALDMKDPGGEFGYIVAEDKR